MHSLRHSPGFSTCILILVMSSGAAGEPGGTALVRRAPAINGTIEGSIRQLLAETVTLNGGARVTGDLLVPGTPRVRLNGRPTYGGTIDGTGNGAPTGYEVILNGNASLRHVVRRADPISLPPFAAPAAPGGTRRVELERVDQGIGDFATLRDLTLGGAAGSVAVPPGDYGEFKASGRSAFVLGVAGAGVPVRYSFRRLIVEGQAQLRVVGPVIVTVANSMELGTLAGSPAMPVWLGLNIASGGLSLKGGAAVYGYVNVPGGTVEIGGNSQLVGGLACDRLSVQGNGVLRLVVAPSANQPPTVRLTAPVDGSVHLATEALVLRATASDPNGTIGRVEFLRGTTKLGEAAIVPYELALGPLPAGSHTFTARATDDQGAVTDSAPVTITVTHPNQPPAVVLTAPADGALFTAPATVAAAATASDADGTIVRVEFFQGTTLLGQATTAPYALSIPNLAAGTYAFSARAVDNLGAVASTAVATVTVVNPNQPPTVALVAPAAGTTLLAPASFGLMANATDADGLVARVEFFQGTTRLGEDTAAPYEQAVSGLAAGTYTFVARAQDNQGSAVESAPLVVSVISPNQAPSVSLTSPAEGAVYGAPAAINLTAAASDPDGTVTRVDYFQGQAKIGEAFAAPFAATWPQVPPGSYVLTARAYDNLGASTVSAPRSLVVQAMLPYFANFEAAEGFVAGPLDGQAGWAASGGAVVADTLAARGSQAVWLPAALPVAQVAHAFPPYAGQTIVFIDAYVRPAAGAAADSAVFWRDEVARVALVGVGGEAELHVLAGDGLGGGVWRATGFRVALAAEGQTSGWLRLTLREDFGAGRWDLYAQGRLIAADLGFRDRTQTSFTQFALSGHATVGTAFDDFFAGFDHPIFADADRDGVEDAWEIRHGLDPARNDRDEDPDGDGVPNLREYQIGTRPDTADSDGDGLNDGLELAVGTNPAIADAAGLPAKLGGLRLHLRADTGVVLDGGGLVQQWQDQSGRANHALQPAADSRPRWESLGFNGRPVLRFDGVNDWLPLPDFMNSATAGQLFGVLRAAAYPSTQSRTPWSFGGENGTSYPAGEILWDDFGAPAQIRLGPPVRDLLLPRLYEVSSRVGEWQARLDDLPQLRTSNATVVFRNNPALGRVAPLAAYYFVGDLAELIVFDRVLPPAERYAVLAYLNVKYDLRLAVAGLLTTAPGGDADGDGLSNRSEIEVYGTNPFRADSDDDGLIDHWEVRNGTQPLNADAGADPDGDGLTNQLEAFLGSAPLRPAAADPTGVLRLRLYRPGQ